MTYPYGPPAAPTPYGAPPTAPFRPQQPVALPRDVCHACRRQAPTRQVNFHQNIGVLVMRFRKQMSGPLCRRCIDKYFWEYTLITFFFGWWGVISFIFTLFILPNNTITYVSSLGLPHEYAPDGSVRMLPPRGTILLVVGSILGATGLLFMGLGVALAVASGDGDPTGGIVLMGTALLFFLVPGALMIIFGALRRKRANALQAAAMSSGYPAPAVPLG